MSAVTPKLNTCPQCGREIPATARLGVCPHCVLGLLEDDRASSFETLHAVEAPTSISEIAMPSSQLAPLSDSTNLRRFGDYELLEEIARGGMGVVYKARQLSLNRVVALKMILSGQFASRQEVLRFRVEAEAAASLHHPNIVAIYETGEHNGQHYFSMQYVAGPNLSQLVGTKPLSAMQAARYAVAVAHAIHYAHQQNTLHRDLKPSNVLIDADDQPRITDFGLTRRLRGEYGITVTGQVLGSPNYMPPEQAGGKRGQTGPFSDVYSIGAILYHLLTARAPFQSETIEETLLQVLNKEPLSPRLLNSSVPRDLETICLKCLEKEPTRRYQTAQELAEELDLFVRDEPVHARPVHAVEKAWRWCRRKPALATSFLIILILLLIVIVGSPIAVLRINAARNMARQSLYAADMKQVQQAWESGNARTAVNLLKAQRPERGQKDLRGFEWRYWWKVCQGEQIFTFHGHTGAVMSVSISRDGRTAASAGRDRTIRLWDIIDHRPRAAQSVRSFATDAIAFSPDGRILVGGDSDFRGAGVALWEMDTGKEITPSFPTRNAWSASTAVAFSPDGKLLAHAEGFTSGSALNPIKLWNLTARQVAAEFRNFQNVARVLAFSPNGQLLAAAGDLGFLKIWDVLTQQEIPTPPMEKLLTISSICVFTGRKASGHSTRRRGIADGNRGGECDHLARLHRGRSAALSRLFSESTSARDGQVQRHDRILEPNDTAAAEFAQRPHRTGLIARIRARRPDAHLRERGQNRPAVACEPERR